MRKWRFIGMLAALMATATDVHSQNIAWEGGHWFDGNDFKARTVYTVGDKIVAAAPPGIDRVVELQGKFVLPAFGDAHHHGIDRREGLAAKNAAFLQAGIFYVKNPNVIPALIDTDLRNHINRWNSIDVVFANGGLTGTGGHPGPLHARLANDGVFPSLGVDDMEGAAYWNLDSVQQAKIKWPRIVAGKPDFIKVFLNLFGSYSPPLAA
jgi:hypothetical protein